MTSAAALRISTGAKAWLVRAKHEGPWRVPHAHISLGVAFWPGPFSKR